MDNYGFIKYFLCVILLLGSSGCKPLNKTKVNNIIHEVYDYHIHLMSPGLIMELQKAGETFSRNPLYYTQLDSIIEINEAEKMIAISMAYLYDSPWIAFNDATVQNIRLENNYLSEQIKKYPNRVVGFFGIAPLRGDAIEEIKRCRDTLGLHGIKLHFNANQIDLNNHAHREKIESIFAFAANKKIPLLVHLQNAELDSGGEKANIFIDSLLSPMESLTVIIAHMGTSGGFTFKTEEILMEFAEAIKEKPQLAKHSIYFDCSAVVMERERSIWSGFGSSNRKKRLTDLIRQLGLERILFGTDYPLINSGSYKELFFENTLLEEDEIEIILGNKLLDEFLEGSFNE